MPGPCLTVVVPAYNEAVLLGETLSALDRSRSVGSCTDVRVVVVDDLSEDTTAAVARSFGVDVVQGSGMGIGAARNTGAASAEPGVLLFVDADTVVPPGLLREVLTQWQGGALLGAVPAEYESDRRAVRALFTLWRWWAPHRSTSQGLCQFVDTGLFASLGGYDEALQMSEDTDLWRRGRATLAATGEAGRVAVLDLRVDTSMRRYEQWPTWRILLFTNPFSTALFRRSRRVWSGWYERAPR